MEDEYIYIPTVSQQKTISLLVIPGSILSFIGSTLIIHYVRQDQKKTPYRRLLLGMSICDIISTIAWISQPFLMDSNAVNSYAWTFGNSVTCTTLGALTQFGITSHLYSAALSVYFLLKIRYGMREATFARKYERLIHLVIILFGFGTAAYGIGMGIFYVSHVGPGCWVAHPPEGDVCADDSCGAAKTAWAFAGIPTLLVFLCIAISNLLLYFHIRSAVMRGHQRALQNESNLSTNDESEKIEDDVPSQHSCSGRTNTTRWSVVLQSAEKQWKRVRDVGTQSFLHFGAYLLCFVWTIAKQSLDGQSFDKIPGSGAYFLPLIILQSIFLPAQGLFNAFIFFRPKYKQARRKHPDETKVWCTKRAIFGATIKATFKATIKSLKRNNVDMVAPKTKQRKISGEKRMNFAGEVMVTTYIPRVGAFKLVPTPGRIRERMSSLTASEGDFDVVVEENRRDDRWGGTSNAHDHLQRVLVPLYRKTSSDSCRFDSMASSLEAISETQASAVDMMNPLEELEAKVPSATPSDISDRPAGSRWGSQRSSNPGQMTGAIFQSLTMPSTMESDSRSLDMSLPSSNASSHSQTQAPLRKLRPNSRISPASSEVSSDNSSKESFCQGSIGNSTAV